MRARDHLSQRTADKVTAEKLSEPAGRERLREQITI